MRRFVGLAVLVMVAASCVDNRANAIDFCESHSELIAAGRDGEALTEDDAKTIERKIEKTMRHAEDATRPVRIAARDLLAAYDEAGRLAADDEAESADIADVEAELQEAREDLRKACVGFVDGGP